MANKRSVKKKVQKTLKKEVAVPVPLPKNKLGETLGKKRDIKAPRYFRESWQELRKVTWPSRKESWKLVLAVIIFTLIFTAITAAADFGFREVVERILL